MFFVENIKFKGTVQYMSDSADSQSAVSLTVRTVNQLFIRLCLYINKDLLTICVVSYGALMLIQRHLTVLVVFQQSLQ
jgi:hypothetical protein